MSHAIYYTSAPEGVKRGSSGFCTVGVSDGIPKGLWDRLETLSAYRHHFAAASGGLNPVSYAHWLLSVAGMNYHVLSRVCDSGVDHTQRTNTFAHHLVAESGELAPGGPAWVLQQSGVMATQWDGQVGTIPRLRIPMGNDYGGICRNWLSATGDAGWGGHLADLFIKTPTKPVCILFSPGQEMLPLMAEAISLLPENQRWNVTFNTYFTSMPTSATCLWRCCLAGTPAAQLGLRYAASGLVIDLTDRSRLGRAPDGAYAEMARTGRAPILPVKSAPAPAKKAAPVKQAGQPAATGPYDLEDEPEPRDVAVADEVVAGVDEELAGEARKAAMVAPVNRARLPDLRSADAALLGAQTEASEYAARRRKHVMLLFIGALAAIGLGMGLVLFVFRGGPPDVNMNTAGGDSGATSHPAPSTLPGPPMIAETHPAPTTTQIVQTMPAPVPPPPPPTPPVPPPPEIHYPETVALKTPLEKPNFGGSIGDWTQSIAYTRGDLNPAPIKAIAYTFPRGESSEEDKPNQYVFKDPPKGTLIATSETRQNKPAVVFSWRDGNENPTDLVIVALDASRNQLDITWKTGPMMKRVELLPALYWIIQSAKLSIDTGKDGAKQQIAFKPYEAGTFDFTDAGGQLKLPMDFPKQAVVTPPNPKSLPTDWQSSWFSTWEEKEPHTPERAQQVVRFKKSSTATAVDAWFLVNFKPGLANFESTFAKRMDADSKQLEQHSSELRAIIADIQQKNRDTGIPLTDPQFKPFLDKQHDAEALVDAYKSVVASYGDLQKFDITIELPQGIVLTTLHFQRQAR